MELNLKGVFMKVRPIARLIISFTASLFLVSTTSFAHYKENFNKNYKAEVPCPTPLALHGGLYLGAAAGYESYRIDTENAGNNQALGGPIINADPNINVSGAVGGAFIG